MTNPRPTRILAIATALLAAAALLPATLASGPAGPARPAPPSATASSFETTTTTKYKLLEINAEKRALLVWDEATETERVIQLGQRTPIRASKRKAFDGRKKLNFDDFAIGQQLLVTSVIATGEVKKVRVRS